MPPVTVNPQGIDPNNPCRFRVKWDGQVIAGITRISGLKQHTQVVAHHEGGDNSTSHLSPGRTEYEPITLERGVTHDTTFEDWAKLVQSALNPSTSLQNFRKEIIIDLFNQAGQLLFSYKVHRCWPSEYVAFGALDANGVGCVAIQSLTLQNEGWERDLSVTEPTET